MKELRQQNFVRCVILKTAQWALDCTRRFPSAGEFRDRFFSDLAKLLGKMNEYTKILQTYSILPKCLCLERSASDLKSAPELVNLSKPSLVLTSPPYPGVHVIYHRWQVKGRWETPAPYWIVNSLDGRGEAYYTFGSRKQRRLDSYFSHALEAFHSIRQIVNKHCIVVQLIAFSDPSWQLPRYLSMMENAGFSEVKFSELIESERIWRDVPNRKWYAQIKGQTSSSREVVLIHRPR